MLKKSSLKYRDLVPTIQPEPGHAVFVFAFPFCVLDNVELIM